MPIFINNGLNERQIGFGNGSFAYGYGQHDEYISEEERGRQQKMHESEKNFKGSLGLMRSDETATDCRFVGLK